MTALRSLPAGTPVAYFPGDGHLPDAHWLGTVEEHRYWADGTHTGLTDIRCTDARTFGNNWVGLVTTVETKKLRVIEAAPELKPSEQLTFQLPA